MDFQKTFVYSSMEFDLYKSEVCHFIKTHGDMEFIEYVKKAEAIPKCFASKKYKEGFYLLAMLDYLCRENSIPIAQEFDRYRKNRLKAPLYPKDVLLLATVSDPAAKEKALQSAIPEFLKYNIVEGNIRDVY